MKNKSVCNTDRTKKDRPMGPTATSYASGSMKNEKVGGRNGMGK